MNSSMLSASQRVQLMILTCSAMFMAMLDNLVLGVALPSIQVELGASFGELQWFMNAYTLAFSVLLIPFSSLGERIGRKRMFLIGVAIFTLGSLASALSTTSLELALSRALQGVGGAGIIPLSLTLVNQAFPVEKRPLAIGIWSGISGLGLSIGPLVGGLIVEGAPWQAIFWINVPIGLAVIILGAFWLKESKGALRKADPIGLLLLSVSLFGIVYGLEEGNVKGWSSEMVMTCLFGGGLLLIAFYFWERTRTSPLIDFTLFRSRSYSSYLLAGFWMMAGIFGSIFLLTLFLQQAQGNSALEAGLKEMTWTGVTMICAPLAGALISRWGARNVLAVGLFLQTAALVYIAVLVQLEGVVFPFGMLLPAMMMAGAGMGLSFTPLAHGVLSSVPAEREAEASGTSNAMRELGGVFGIAIGGLIFARGAAIQTPADFGTHLIPALFVLSGLLMIGFISVWMVTKTAKSTDLIHGTA